MSLRDKLAVSDLLHGRWSDKTGYLYLRLDGEARVDDNERIIQPVELMERDSTGLWLPVTAGDPQEIRCYRRGLGELEGPVLDGSSKSIIYRVGVKKRQWTSRGKKGESYCFRVTDRIDTAQSSLPPTSSEQAPPAPGGPSGGPQQSSNGMHTPASTPPTSAATSAAGPPAPVPSLPEQGAKRFCASCGKPTGGISVCPHCGVAQ